MKKYGIGIVGCGVISDIYLKNLSTVFENTKVVAVCDSRVEVAKEKAKKYGIAKAQTFEEMLADDEVEIVLNITTPNAHFEIAERAMKAHKHVYTEKPLALTYAQCKELMEIAKENNVYLGCAPDTFLGTTYQKARELIDCGVLGEITSAYTFDVCHGHENWHPNPDFFYEKGAGPLYDRGPYNIACLTMLLGPADYVVGMTGQAFAQRQVECGPRLGEKVAVHTPTHTNALVHFASGALCVMSTSFDVWGSDLPYMELHGTKGSMRLPIPIDFGGELSIKLAADEAFQPVAYDGAYTVNSRGLGLSDMIRAIEHGGDYRCNAERSAHAIEIMEAVHDSSDQKKFIALESTCQQGKAMDLSLMFGKVGSEVYDGK